MARETRKQRNLKIKQNAAREASRRQAQSENAQPKKLVSPDELVKGFTADIIELESHARNLEQFIKTRIELIYRLKENTPEKFTTLNDAPFKELQDKMNGCLDAIRTLFELVGTIADMEKFSEKLTTIHDNWGKLMEAQIQFQGFAMHMQSVDEQFNKQYQSLLTPPQNLEVTKDGREMPMAEEEKAEDEFIVEVSPDQVDESAAETPVEEETRSENSENTESVQ